MGKKTIVEAFFDFCENELIDVDVIELKYSNKDYKNWEDCLKKTRQAFFYAAFSWDGDAYWKDIAEKWYVRVMKLKEAMFPNKIKTLQEVEEDYMMAIVKLFDGNKTRAAKALGVSIRKLRYYCNSK